MHKQSHKRCCHLGSLALPARVASPARFLRELPPPRALPLLRRHFASSEGVAQQPGNSQRAFARQVSETASSRLDMTNSFIALQVGSSGGGETGECTIWNNARP